MTDRSLLQQTLVAKMREHCEFLKHNVATWQLLARAADEIERLSDLVAEHETVMGPNTKITPPELSE